MLSKERFRYILLLISTVLLIPVVTNSIGGCTFFQCSSPILLWMSIGGFTTVIFSKFSSPRRGRYAFSFFIGPGCAIIQLIVFAALSQIWSSTAEDSAQFSKFTIFDSIYRFCALMLLYLVSAYTLAFKQHLAWNTILLLTSHYNVFSVIVIGYRNSIFPPGNFLAVLGCLALVFATELLNRNGRNRAQALVLTDSKNSQKHWSDLIDNKPDFKKEIERVRSTISRGGLAAVCERLDTKTKNFVPRIVLQEHTDIDRLYRDCSVLNFFFQDWIRTWFSSGTRSDKFEFCNPKAPYKEAFKIHVANCFPDIVRGPIKAPNRVISKVALAIMFPCIMFSHMFARVSSRQGVASCLIFVVLLCVCEVTSLVRCTARTAGGLIV